MDQLKAENARLRALVDALQAGAPLWESAMKLDEDRATVLSGSTSRLQEMVASGSDIRVVTQFRHNEHVDAASANAELVLEPSSFPITVALCGSHPHTTACRSIPLPPELSPRSPCRP